MRAMGRWLVPIVFLAGFLLDGTGGAGASNWGPGLLSGSNGEAQAMALPLAPTGQVATCSGTRKVVVTWNALALATSYSIFESTTSATSSYSVVATGVTGTNWTSGNLGAGNYWFEVAASIGTNWQGPNSSATSQRTITQVLIVLFSCS
jgi:hypothetical protein